MLRLARSPRWVGALAVAVLASVVCALLGRWQWDRSQSAGGDLQNLAYAFNWWLFSALCLGVWGKALREETSRLADPDAEPVGVAGVAGRQRPPAVVTAAAMGHEVDPEVAEWNDWLAELASRPARRAHP